MDVSGDVVNNWQDFKDSWRNYATATELHKKDKTIIVATLHAIMGKDCYRVLKNLAMTDDERKSPEKIIEKLGEYFEPQKNIIYERFMFNSRVQESTETFEEFLLHLRELASTCKYDKLCDELIRDRIVIAIKDNSVRKRLLREADLDLNKTIAICRTSELAEKQIQQIDKTEVVHATRQRKVKKITCSYCGEIHEQNRRVCPAFGKKCSLCDRVNHFAKVCRNSKHTEKTDRPISKEAKIHYKNNNYMIKYDRQSSQDENSADEDYCYANANSGKKSAFFVDVEARIENSRSKQQSITFQLDTGSSSNTLKLEDYKKLSNKPPPPSGKRLIMYNKDVLIPVGLARLCCTINGITKTIYVDIVKDAPSSLLSAKSCIAFKLMTLVDCVYRTASNDTLNEECIVEEYHDIFKGLGTLPGEYHIKVDRSIKPVKHNARRVPAPLAQEIKEKLDNLEKSGIIAKVKTPTQWISSMVAVKKPNKLRLCIDPSDLNKAVQRNHYPTPVIDDILPRLSKAKVFSVVDAKDGFLQIKLDNQSSYLTTFYTPFGLYRWLRMPFGLKSAPEEFQRRLDECLEGLKNVAVIADDILIYGTGNTDNEAEKSHDAALIALLNRCRECGLKLNKNKLRFKLDSVTYMGHVISKEGVCPDPEKVVAIDNMEKPTNVQAVQRFLGMVTYLAKFLPQLSTVCEPLRRLTDKDAVFEWLQQHDEAFTEVKRLITQAPVLSYYDVNKPVELESDSSDVGLGAVITQGGRPIAYASRALTQTERNYAQIEKECLSLVFATERFEQYILGKDNVTMWTDHKPLEVICKKSILTSPKRLQRMRLRLQKFSVEVRYKPGKSMYISDTLSRASLPLDKELKDKSDYIIFKVVDEQDRREEIESIVPEENIFATSEDNIFVTDKRLENIRHETACDDNMQTLRNIIKDGWPDDKMNTPNSAREYWPYRDEMTTQNGIIFRGTRVVIPPSMRQEMKKRAHASHLGEQYTISTAREVMFWPRMHTELIETVKRCRTCQEEQRAQQKEPMIIRAIPTHPWQTVASDCFELNNKAYVVVVDVYSGYIDFARLSSMTSKSIIAALKPMFATHGAPVQLLSDNGRNYISQEFEQFSKDWEFEHVTCSPHYHKSNGRAEAAVKIMKNILKKSINSNTDVHKALLEWRNAVAPGETASPAQKLMSRRTRSLLPCSQYMYTPRAIKNVPNQIRESRQKAKSYYDAHTKPLPKLEMEQSVLVQTHPHIPHSKWSIGRVLKQVAPRSYLVEVDGKRYKRNRIHLRTTNIKSENDDTWRDSPIAEDREQQDNIPPDAPPAAPVAAPAAAPAVAPAVAVPDANDVVRTRYGRISKPNPKYTTDFVP